MERRKGAMATSDVQQLVNEIGVVENHSFIIVLSEEHPLDERSLRITARIAIYRGISRLGYFHFRVRGFNNVATVILE